MSFEDLDNSPCQLPTILEEPETEQIWSPEVEEALIEAMKIYPACGRKKIKHTDGVKYGRNAMLAFYIKKKCGKERSARQVSSHVQFLERRVNLNLKKLLSPSIPKTNLSTSKDMMEFRNSYDLVFMFAQFLKDNYYDTSNLAFLQNLPYNMSIRKISTSKLGIIGIFACLSSNQDFFDRILFGLTCSNDLKINNVSFKKIAHRFDRTLNNLITSLPTDNFYVVKTYGNLNIMDGVPLNYVWHQIFYSAYNMDIRMELYSYVYGQLIWIETCDSLAMDEVQIGRSKYYLYHFEYSMSEFGEKFTQNMLFLKKSQKEDTIKKALENHAAMIILKDNDTQDVLLVMPVIFDYDPNFSGYQLYRINP